jgi:molybdopterin molybdotransferase
VQKTAIAHGLTLDFYKVAMRPGKPLMAGRLGAVPLIGLPGNPVSAMVCGLLFLRPAVDAMLGLPAGLPPVQRARLAGAIGGNGPREHYMRATVTAGDGGWQCDPFERQDSSLLSVLAAANALMVRPPHDPARQAGEMVDFLWL